MRVRFESECADLSDLVAEGQIALPKVCPEDEGIHKQTDHVFDFEIVSGGDWGSNQDAFLPGIAPEQGLESGE